MKNSKLRRILLTLACAVLLVSLSVGATLAYLTSTTEIVQNTFTVGKVEITLDEAKVNEYGEILYQVDEDGEFVLDDEGKKIPLDRVTANTYKLIPGHEYYKDPTVHVSDDSEVSWLFVKVVNEIAAIEAGYDPEGAMATIQEQMDLDMALGGSWVAIDSSKGIWAYSSKVSADQDIVVFTGFALDGNANVAAYAGKNITVQAYAVQADGFETAQDAWAAAPLTTW